MTSPIRLLRDTVRPMLSLRTEYRLRRGMLRVTPVTDRSPVPRIVHAGVWKTGSQWIRLLLSDPRLYRHGGHLPYVWGDVRRSQPLIKEFQSARRAALLACFGTVDDARAIVGDDPFRAIFLTRDPRDSLVSWYFSTRYSHGPTPGVIAHRQAMNGMSEVEGLAHMADAFTREFVPVFDSWSRLAEHSDAVRLLRFEHFVKQSDAAQWADLLSWLGIQAPPDVVARVLDTYSVDKLKKGTSDTRIDKYGEAARRNWRDYLDAPALAKHRDRLTELAQRLGYG